MSDYFLQRVWGKFLRGSPFPRGRAAGSEQGGPAVPHSGCGGAGRAPAGRGRLRKGRGGAGPGRRKGRKGREGGEGKKGRRAGQGRQRGQDGAGGAGAEEPGVAE